MGGTDLAPERLGRDSSDFEEGNIMTTTMTEQEVQALWPEFMRWVTKVRGYAAVGGHWVVVLWYEFLETKQKEGKGNERD